MTSVSEARSHALDDDGDALADANAHRAERVPACYLMQWIVL